MNVQVTTTTTKISTENNRVYVNYDIKPMTLGLYNVT